MSITEASGIDSWARMSSLTRDGAVAVSARTGGWPRARTASPRPRYAGRKSWPHCEMQCASSTTNSGDVDAGQPSAEARLAEPLRGDVGDAGSARRQPGQRLGLVPRRQRGVEPEHLDVEALELVVLILHQGDQRRHHQGDAGELERGQLVAQRLAGAGRHDRQGVDAGEDVADGERLPGAEVVDAEPVVTEGEGAGVDLVGGRTGAVTAVVTELGGRRRRDGAERADRAGAARQVGPRRRWRRRRGRVA